MSTIIHKRLKQLTKRIQEKDYSDQLGIGSDIPHYVFDYDPQDELVVRDHIRYMLKILPNIKEINLFQLLLGLFEEDLEDLLDLGDEEGLDGLREAISPTLETHALEEALIEEARDAELIFLTGVGSSHPFIRSSKVLKRLSEMSYKVPMILFYPGQFTGLQLKLFNIHNTEDQYQLSRLA
jgi:hypothetical protein